jgi:hypothetical protein
LQRTFGGAAVLATTLCMPAVLWVFGSPCRLRNGRNRLRVLLAIVLVLPLLLILVSCSGVSAQGDGGTTLPPSNPVTYRVTVSASSPGLPDSASHSIIVELIVD